MRLFALLSLVLACGACGGDDGAPIDRPRTFGGARPVELQIPTAFDDGERYPLLVILHGYGATAFLQQSYFHLFDAPDAFETLVLAPEGTADADGSQFWNADLTCCDQNGAGIDDVGYLGGLIDDVIATWPVDPARVTVIGHSNGAFLAYRLACARADVVTAIAGLAGHAVVGVPCAPADPVSVLHLHGNADETVPYDSGTFSGVESPGAIASVAQWATRNGCTGAPTAAGTKDLETALPGAETTVTVTGGCPTAGAADLWTIAGGTHIPSLSATFPAEVMAWSAAHPRR